MKNILKYLSLVITMVSLAASAFTSLLGWQGTALEYNAYFQAGIALCIFLWLVHKALSYSEHKWSKPIRNARDK